MSCFLDGIVFPIFLVSNIYKQEIDSVYNKKQLVKLTFKNKLCDQYEHRGTVGARIPNIGIPNILKFNFPMVQKQDG